MVSGSKEHITATGAASLSASEQQHGTHHPGISSSGYNNHRDAIEDGVGVGNKREKRGGGEIG